VFGWSKRHWKMTYSDCFPPPLIATFSQVTLGMWFSLTIFSATALRESRSPSGGM
jgi:hypothetical protein